MPTLLIQQIRLQWYKDCRGGNYAVQRNQYTQTFNKMRFIETEERDEIYMALRGILDALPGDTLQKDALIEQFEQLRDF